MAAPPGEGPFAPQPPLAATFKRPEGQESTMIRKFLQDESGATMVEYGIMVALIAAIAIAIIKVVGSKTSNAFQNVNNAY